MNDQARTVRELLADPPTPDQDVAVRGHLVDEGGHTVLCDRLGETFPPQPGGSTIPVSGIELATLSGTATTGDTTWTATARVIVGRLSGRTLEVRAVTDRP